jgi:hypothetical protein
VLYDPQGLEKGILSVAGVGISSCTLKGVRFSQKEIFVTKTQNRKLIGK